MAPEVGKPVLGLEQARQCHPTGAQDSLGLLLERLALSCERPGVEARSRGGALVGQNYGAHDGSQESKSESQSVSSGVYEVAAPDPIPWWPVT